MADLLDCTIREGGYALNFKWEPDEIRNIVGELALAGLRYIEIGHGLGLGASRVFEPSLCDDVEMTQIASSCKGSANIGAFFIPGVGTEEDLQAFRLLGGDFIRIGSDVSRSQEAWRPVEIARKLGFQVFYNFMKSYTARPSELVGRALPIQERGAHVITIVDSAGGMLPSTVGQYVRLLRDALDVKIGFHGHNNLLLANANCLAAVEHGAAIVDSTLLGIGRGGGNAQTESMIVILEKSDRSVGIDPLRVSDIADRYVASKCADLKGATGMEILLGYAFFHSGHVEKVASIAKGHGVDLRQLILEVSRFNQENPSVELITEAATLLRDQQTARDSLPAICS